MVPFKGTQPHRGAFSDTCRYKLFCSKLLSLSSVSIWHNGNETPCMSLQKKALGNPLQLQKQSFFMYVVVQIKSNLRFRFQLLFHLIRVYTTNAIKVIFISKATQNTVFTRTIYNIYVMCSMNVTSQQYASSCYKTYLPF